MAPLSLIRVTGADEMSSQKKCEYMKYEGMKFQIIHILSHIDEDRNKGATDESKN